MNARAAISWIVPALVALLAASPAVPAQPASAPRDAGPVWSKHLQLAVGRTFITDGAFAVGASIASFRDLSKLSVVPGAVLDRYVQAPYTKEYPASDLNARRGHYIRRRTACC